MDANRLGGLGGARGKPAGGPLRELPAGRTVSDAVKFIADAAGANLAPPRLPIAFREDPSGAIEIDYPDGERQRLGIGECVLESDRAAHAALMNDMRLMLSSAVAGGSLRVGVLYVLQGDHYAEIGG